jgi:hypothetical protein
MDLLPVMQRPVSILRERLREASKTGETLNMKYMYAAVTLDIINDYCFARDPFYIRQSDFGRKGFDDVDSFLTVSILVSRSKLYTKCENGADDVRTSISPGLCDLRIRCLYVHGSSSLPVLTGIGRRQQDPRTCNGRYSGLSACKFPFFLRTLYKANRPGPIPPS